MELWHAQAGGGKTEAILSLIAATVRHAPLARIWVVLPNSRQRAQFRARMLDALRDERLPAFNVELFNFHSLNRRLLSLLNVPVKSLRGGARQAVLRRIAARERLSAFGTVATTSGFSRAVGDLIAELKQDGITPADFISAAQRPQDEDIARLYDAYQTILHTHGLVDTEGEAWLALEALTAAESFQPHIALLAVDGFDQFTEVQAQLIRTLNEYAERTVVTLTTVDGREDGVGRRFAAAATLLGEPAISVLPAVPHTNPAVRHLLDCAFSFDTDAPIMAADAAQSLTFIEAHSPSAEAAEVMRHVKARLVHDGAAPDDIMIVLRDWARYQPALSSAAAEYGVPVSLQSGTPLTRHPLTAALDAVLTLPETGYAFGAVIDALRSPYIVLDGLPPDVLAKVERAARQYRLRVGRETWDIALDVGARPGRDYLGRETPPILTRDEWRGASDALNMLFDALPQANDTGSVWQFVERIESLIGADPDHETDAEAKFAFTLDIARQVRTIDASGDDLAALRAIKETLRDMLLAEDLLSVLTGDDRTLTWQEFLADFTAALANADHSAMPDRSGRVLIVTANDARGWAHKHVYVLGLSEGIFPGPLANDPLYLESERAGLVYKGRTLLRSAANRADDDSIFFELLAQARQTLTLSRPMMNGGQAWPPSALWNAVTALLETNILADRRIRVAPGLLPDATRAASLPELAAVLYARTSASRTYLDTHDTMRAAHIAHAQRVERSRAALAASRDRCELPEYCGDLTAPDFSGLTGKLGRPDYLWSPSTINGLATSAYSLFAEKLLGLDVLEDPAEGADAALEGSLMHQILEATYAGFRSRRKPITPEYLPDALAALDAAAAEVFQNAIDNRDFIPSAIWQHQQMVLVRYLRELVRLDFSAESPVTAEFGAGTRWTMVTEKKFGDDRPVEIAVPTDDGEVRFRLTGSIDRVDCIETDSAYHLVVIDYKRGSPISAADVAEGRHTQIVLYTAALQHIIDDPFSLDRVVWFNGLPQKPVIISGGFFWSVRTGQPLHVMSPTTAHNVQNTSYTSDDLRALCLHGVAQRIAAIRTGDFRPLPGKTADGKCARFCQFADLCRVCELL